MSRIAGSLLALALFVTPALAGAQNAQPSGSPVPSAAPAAPIATPNPDKMLQLAEDVFQQLLNRRIDHTMFSDQMNGFLSDDNVRQLGGQLSGVVSPSFSFISDAQTTEGDTAYTFLLRSSSGNLDEIIAQGPDGKIVFLRFVPDHTH